MSRALGKKKKTVNRAIAKVCGEEGVFTLGAWHSMQVREKGLVTINAPRVRVVRVEHAMATLSQMGIDASFLKVLMHPSIPPPAPPPAPTQPPSPPQDPIGTPTHERPTAPAGTPPQAHPQVHPPPKANPLHLPPLPTTLPTLAIEDVMCEDAKARYGLNAIMPLRVRKAMARELDIELLPFKEWSTNVIQLDRPQDVGMIASCTWLKEEKNVKSFIGYAYTNFQVNTASLLTYWHANIWMAYITFLIARGVSTPHLACHTFTAIRACTFMLCTHKATHITHPHDIIAWLKNLRHQLTKNLMSLPPRLSREPKVLERLGRWVSPHVLTTLVLKVRDNALQALSSHKKGDMTRRECALALHKSLLACFFWGHLPPLRPSIVASLTIPHVHGRCCLHDDCPRPHQCKGNRVEVEVEGGPTTYSLVVPHHKNARRWHWKPILCPLPKDLCDLLVPYLEWGHDELCKHATSPIPYLFVNVVGDEEDIKPLSMHQVSILFNKCMFKENGMEDLFVGAQKLRSIFINSLTCATPNPSMPNAIGASHIMGHCTKQWALSYDREWHGRHVSEAMEAMPSWRRFVLDHGGGHGGGGGGMGGDGAPSPSPSPSPCTSTSTSTMSCSSSSSSSHDSSLGGGDDEESLGDEGGHETSSSSSLMGGDNDDITLRHATLLDKKREMEVVEEEEERHVASLKEELACLAKEVDALQGAIEERAKVHKVKMEGLARKRAKIEQAIQGLRTQKEVLMAKGTSSS
jgi:hypothetical protein